MAEAKKKSGSKKKSNKIFLAFIASIAGCIAGFFLVQFLMKKDYHAIIIVGPCCGFASLIFMRVRNNMFGIWCLLISLAATLLAENSLPAHATKSFNYFFSHLGELGPKTLASIVMGPLIAFYFGRGPKDK